MSCASLLTSLLCCARRNGAGKSAIAKTKVRVRNFITCLLFLFCEMEANRSWFTAPKFPWRLVPLALICFRSYSPAPIGGSSHDKESSPRHIGGWHCRVYRGRASAHGLGIGRGRRKSVAAGGDCAFRNARGDSGVRILHLSRAEHDAWTNERATAIGHERLRSEISARPIGDFGVQHRQRRCAELWEAARRRVRDRCRQRFFPCLHSGNGGGRGQLVLEARVRRDARWSFRGTFSRTRVLELVQLPNDLHVRLHRDWRPRLVLRRPRHGGNRQTTDGNDLTRCLVNAITKELPSTNR